MSGLHASASIFETLAKDVMNTSAVDSQPLGAFFEGYRKKSLLPDPVLDYMLEIYKARNTQPMAGHGSLNPPTVDAAQATVLCELTKSIVRIERSLAEQAIDLRKAAIPQKTSATPGPPGIAAVDHWGVDAQRPEHYFCISARIGDILDRNVPN